MSDYARWRRSLALWVDDICINRNRVCIASCEAEKRRRLGLASYIQPGLLVAFLYAASILLRSHVFCMTCVLLPLTRPSPPPVRPFRVYRLRGLLRMLRNHSHSLLPLRAYLQDSVRQSAYHDHDGKDLSESDQALHLVKQRKVGVVGGGTSQSEELMRSEVPFMSIGTITNYVVKHSISAELGRGIAFPREALDGDAEDPDHTTNQKWDIY